MLQVQYNQGPNEETYNKYTDPEGWEKLAYVNQWNAQHEDTKKEHLFWKLCH